MGSSRGFSHGRNLYGRPIERSCSPVHDSPCTLGVIRSAFNRKSEKATILSFLDGLIEGGELLLVLGRPGSGCSTIAGETTGLTVDPMSEINYSGIPFTLMHKRYQGECIYSAETDIHFPELTVGETLQFAAQVRTTIYTAQNTSGSLKEHVRLRWQSVESSLQLTSASNTYIGNALQRGVSGGEKRRVTLAETILSNAAVQCWDNSTRGMDSATALAVMKTLRATATTRGITAIVSLYQASQPIVDLFDQILLLHGGEQIFFGTSEAAVNNFSKLGFSIPQRTSVADYLTAITNPAEARQFVREGVEHVPRTKEDFVQLWKGSSTRHDLIQRIKKHQKPVIGILDSSSQNKHSARKPAYAISIGTQVICCMNRWYRRRLNSISIPVSTIVGNAILAAIIGALFLNLDDTAASVAIRSNLLFLSVLLNGFMSGSEVFAIWDQRLIVEKHARYAFYHPMAESLAALLCDLPIKLLSSVCFNAILCFMANLRRSAEAFFKYWLFAFVCHVTLSTWFRCAGSFCKTFGQLTVPLGLWHLALITYSGYVIPVQYMRGWLRWIRYLSPMTYAFESMAINEFKGRKFPCREFIPSGPAYAGIPSESRVCAQIGTGSSVNGMYIDGSTYIQNGLGFEPDNIWRNLGILFALMMAFIAIYLLASEFILTEAPGADVLLFPQQLASPHVHSAGKHDEENLASEKLNREGQPSEEKQLPTGLQRAPGIFHWVNLNYDIPGNKNRESRRLLTDISGWVEPGSLTALMGATGAGKTTLLDVLAGRTSTGNVSGQILYKAGACPDALHRKIGFVQQQDLHLSTSTVREALQFSAKMRLDEGTLTEKMEYVEEVISVLGMRHFADAMIGTLGQGLNVEQLRRLSIGVELVAKPDLLFLDEPTSGLDSQTAWAICSLLKDLARHGQAILCTLHQPSASLFEMFDKLLLIQEGGKTLYYGDVGHRANIVTEYFQSKAETGKACGSDQNPAEWIFDLISTKAGNWEQKWKDSDEFSHVQEQLSKLSDPSYHGPNPNQPASGQKPFATPLFSQMNILTRRTFTSYWRTPRYLWCNILYSMCASALISVSCPSTSNGLQGLKTQLFAIFLFCTIFSNLSHQLLPTFTKHRDLFEAREGRSQIYSWKAFLVSIIVTEAFWNTVASILAFILFYFPLGIYNGRSTDALLAWLYTWAFFLFTSTMSHLLIAGMQHAETAANIGFLLFYLCLIFCGVLVPKSQLSRFWIFMYRVSPLTYIVAGLFAVGVSNRTVDCLQTELLVLESPDSMTCGQYLAPYLESGGGKLLNPDATNGCQICPVRDASEFLNTLSIRWEDRRQYLGYIFVFVFFNAGMTFVVYWLSRGSKLQRRKKI